MDKTKIIIDQNCSRCDGEMHGIQGELIILNKGQGIWYLFCKECMIEYIEWKWNSEVKMENTNEWIRSKS